MVREVGGVVVVIVLVLGWWLWWLVLVVVVLEGVSLGTVAVGVVVGGDYKYV